ncbi:MAG: ABC transporter substrate-binding protein [Desulfovibrionaceae bacterium]
MPIPIHMHPRRPLPRRSDRRRPAARLAALLAALLAAVLLAACGDAPTEPARAPAAPAAPTADAPAPPAPARTLRLALAAGPSCLDIHAQLTGPQVQFAHVVYDPLVRWDRDMQLAPRLARSWERLDDRTLRLHLRPGVRFHSGNPFTARDVVWTLDRLKRSNGYKGLFAPFERAVAVDDLTVDLITARPYGLALNVLAYLFPMDSAYYTGPDDQGRPRDAIGVTAGPGADVFACTHVSGTGPFRLVQAEADGRLTLDRFPDYWDPDTGNVERIELTPIASEAGRTAALLSGAADFISPVPPQDLPRIVARPDLTAITLPGTRTLLLQLNQTRVKALADRRVRRAMRLATNNTGIAEAFLRGLAAPAGQLSPPGFAGHDPGLVPRYDLARARRLMAEAGWAKGFSVTMIAPNDRYICDEEIAQAFVTMMARIGIEVRLTTMPKAQYWPRFEAREADIQMIGWHADTEDSANFYEMLAMCPDARTGYGRYNSGGYCNPEVDRLTLAAQGEIDPHRRTALLRRVERLLYDDAAFIPLHWQYLSWAARKDLNAGRVVNVMDFPYFGDLRMP